MLLCIMSMPSSQKVFSFFSTSLNQITLNNSYREITWCQFWIRLVVKLASFLPLFWNVLSYTSAAILRLPCCEKPKPCGGALENEQPCGERERDRDFGRKSTETLLTWVRKPSWKWILHPQPPHMTPTENKPPAQPSLSWSLDPQDCEQNKIDIYSCGMFCGMDNQNKYIFRRCGMEFIAFEKKNYKPLSLCLKWMIFTCNEWKATFYLSFHKIVSHS